MKLIKHWLKGSRWLKSSPWPTMAGHVQRLADHGRPWPTLFALCRHSLMQAFQEKTSALCRHSLVQVFYFVIFVQCCFLAMFAQQMNVLYTSKILFGSLVPMLVSHSVYITRPQVDQLPQRILSIIQPRPVTVIFCLHPPVDTWPPPGPCASRFSACCCLSFSFPSLSFSSSIAFADASRFIDSSSISSLPTQRLKNSSLL